MITISIKTLQYHQNRIICIRNASTDQNNKSIKDKEHLYELEMHCSLHHILSRKLQTQPYIVTCAHQTCILIIYS